MLKEVPGTDPTAIRPEDRKTPLDIPITSFTDFDSVQLVKATLKQHELGYFAGSSQLIDRMGWDDRIQGVLSTRCNAILGLPLTFEDGDTMFAEWLTKNWTSLVPDEYIRETLRWSVMAGFALGQQNWYKDVGGVNIVDGLLAPQLRAWHLQHSFWRWDTRQMQVSTMSGIEDLAVGDKQWVIYSPNGPQLGWLGGAIRSLAIPFMCRQWALRDWARNSEVHGMPIRAAVAPGDAKKADKDMYLQQIAALGRESTILLPQAGEGKNFDLKLVEAAADSHKVFMELIEQCNTSIAIVLLGQNLTTEVSGGGSRAAAQVHDSVRTDLKRADANSLAIVLREQVLKPMALLNFGDEEAAPFIRWQVEPDEDKTAKASGLLSLGQALVAFKSVTAPIDQRELLTQFDLPLVSEQEEAEMQAEAQAQADAEAEAAAAAQAEPGAPPTEGKSKPEGKGRVTATNRHRDPPSALHGQLFVDALADHTKALGAKALAPMLKAVLEDVTAAHSYEDLRHRLIKRYAKRLPHNEMQELLEKAMVLADLAGARVVVDSTKE